MEKIIIPRRKYLAKIIGAIKKGGREKIHVLADFDKTITKAFVKGQKSPTVVAQIRNGNYLTPDYAPRAHALFDKYYLFEHDFQLTRKQRQKKMEEWWQKHYNLLVECGLDKKVMKEVVGQKTLQFRKGALDFLDFLNEKKIPLVIMSAGSGDMIKEYLKQEGRFYPNIHIIANFFKFNKKGRVVGVSQDVIHSLNKYETAVKDFPVFKIVKKRKNVILLGDSLEDAGMIEGFDYDNLIKIGFLSHDKKNLLAEYKKKFEVILVDDEGMKGVNELLKEILN